jgi:hypothetical protein
LKRFLEDVIEKKKLLRSFFYRMAKPGVHASSTPPP